MRNILFGVCTVVLSALFGGCVSSGPAPQDVKLQSPDGKAVIIKDIYELPAVEHSQLSSTDIIKVFFPDIDNIKTNFSVTFLKIPSGIAQAKHKQSSAQIIYAISGGGKLTIDSNMIILKKGTIVYIPSNAIMSITNNVPKVLELMVIATPPFKPSELVVLGDAPGKVKVSVDPETKMEDEPTDIQAVSEKYKTEKESRRSLSIEEYRNKLNKSLTPVTEKDPLPDLLQTTKKTESEIPSWPLKMPDSNTMPLKKLETKQIDKLIPQKPEKIEDTSTKGTEVLTRKEEAVPLSDDNVQKPAAADSKTTKKIDPLQKLLDDQKKHEENLIPKKPLEVKKTSLQHVQELSPTENAVQTKSQDKSQDKSQNSKP